MSVLARSVERSASRDRSAVILAQGTVAVAGTSRRRKSARLAAFVLAVVLSAAAGLIAHDAATPAPVTMDGAPAAREPTVARSLDSQIRSGHNFEKGIAALSWVSEVAVLFGLGGALFLLLIRPGPLPAASATPLEIRRSFAISAIGAGVAGVASIPVRAAVISGAGMSAVGDPHLLAYVLRSPFGVASLLRIVGLFGIWASFRSPPRGDGLVIDLRDPAGASLVEPHGGHSHASDGSRRVGMISSMALATASFSVVGHAEATDPKALLIVVLTIHVLAASLWLGGLAFVTMEVRARRAGRWSADRRTFRSCATPAPEGWWDGGESVPLRGWRAGGATSLDVRVRPSTSSAPSPPEIVGRFSVTAGLAVAAALLSGIALAWSQVPDVDALLHTSYGATLAAKIVLVLLIVGLGSYNHYVLMPEVVGRDDEEAWEVLARTVRVEVCALVFGVVPLTAALASGGLVNLLS